MSPEAHDRPELNEFQKRRLTVTCQYIDKQLMNVEAVLDQSVSKAAFPKYRFEIPPAQRRTIEGYIARIRAQLLRILDGQRIAMPAPFVSPVHAIHVDLTFIEIAAEELFPQYMRGYGDVPAPVAVELNGIAGELLGLASKLDRYVRAGIGEDLKDRLEHLDKVADEYALLRAIERVVSARGMIEYRQAIANILDRAEDKSFEIAVFGRVSSGKSSLLNAILGSPVLPVGVTPITAVPTRIVFGERASLNVWFAERPTQSLEIDLLSDYATEQGNPGNRRHVTRIVVELPATRLQSGVSFVDTPGLGSLATTGATETLVYLPKCDLGIVLIDAGSTLTPDDIRTIESLHEAAIPAQALLSKADLLSDDDRARVIAYVTEQLSRECSLDLPVHAVSALPSHHELLDRWFEADILPLYQRSQELRAASLRRKVAVLRDSVASSLALFLRADSAAAGPSAEKIRAVEARLRGAHGAIEAMASAIETETATMPSRVQEPIDASASDLTEFWRRSSDLPDSADARAAKAAARSIQLRVQELRKEIESLAERLATDLQASAETLAIPDKPNRDDFASLVREVPAFEPPLVKLESRRPRLLGVLGNRVARAIVRRKLMRDLAPQLAIALETYAGLLRSRALNILQELRAHFESYADNYRAQAAAHHGRETLTAPEIAAIRADLESLGANSHRGTDSPNKQRPGSRRES
jgi:GTP-binding protein EngB required for normal cell division